MNILLTNDDGYDSEGIKILERILTNYGEVFIYAPKEAMSAKSTSITLKEIEVEKLNEHLYIVDGFPADCVSFALSTSDIKFDLVVSGCNHGFNLSFDTLYSGTIGACLNALTFKIPSIALSIEFNFDILTLTNFDKVYKFILINNLLSDEHLLNINFPRGNIIDSIELTSLYYRNPKAGFKKVGINKYIATRTLEDENAPSGSDCYAVNHNIVSITPLYRSYFNQELFNNLEKNIK